MNSLKQIKQEYKQKKITKPEFTDKMFGKHRQLFEYAEFIKETGIGKIEITDDSVIMISRKPEIRMVCDNQDKGLVPFGILNFGHYEREELNMGLKLIRKNSVVFDVGANIGWYAMNIAKLISGAKIYAFEPILKTYIYLRQNLALNRITNVRAEKFGLAEKNHKITFYYYPAGSSNASAANLTGLPEVIKVGGRVRTLDSFMRGKKIRRLDFIKCDVEGGELLVFKGGMRTLQLHKPVVFCEMLRKWSAPFGYHPNDIIKLLGGLGYLCFTVSGKFLKPFDKMDEQTVETNFFFLHSKKHFSQIRRFTKK